MSLAGQGGGEALRRTERRAEQSGATVSQPTEPRDNLVGPILLCQRPADSGLAPYQLACAHMLVDEWRLAAHPLPEENPAAAWMEARCGQDPLGVLRAWRSLDRRLRASGKAREGVLDLIRQRLADWGEPLDKLKEMTMADAIMLMDERLQEWKEGWRQEGLLEGRQEGRREGRQEGRREGRQEGRREGLATVTAVLHRLAVGKYGHKTAGQLQELLRGPDNPALLEDVANLVMECATGEEVIDRARRRLQNGT